jgi:hypothetical protein
LLQIAPKVKNIKGGKRRKRHFLPKNEKVPIGEIEIETLCQNRAGNAFFAFFVFLLSFQNLKKH